MVLRMKRLRPGAEPPQRQTAGSAGFDLKACMEAPVTLKPVHLLHRLGGGDPPGLRGADVLPQRAGGQARRLPAKLRGCDRQRLPRGTAGSPGELEPGALYGGAWRAHCPAGGCAGVPARGGGSGRAYPNGPRRGRVWQHGEISFRPGKRGPAYLVGWALERCIYKEKWVFIGLCKLSS